MMGFLSYHGEQKKTVDEDCKRLLKQFSEATPEEKAKHDRSCHPLATLREGVRGGGSFNIL